MKDRYIIAVLAVFLQIAVLVGCSGRESNSIEIASVNGEKILASDFDLAKAQYESKNMLDAELLDGLIKERIVLQYGEKIEPLSTCKRIQLRGDSVLIDQEEDTLRNITFTEAQEVYGNFLYIPNEMEQYDSIEILGYHNVREQIKVLRIDYIDEKQKMPISISLIVSPDLEMGEEKVISENSGVNIVEYNIAQIGVKYSICSSLEVETIEEVLDRIIPYVLQ